MARDQVKLIFILHFARFIDHCIQAVSLCPIDTNGHSKHTEASRHRRVSDLSGDTDGAANVHLFPLLLPEMCQWHERNQTELQGRIHMSTVSTVYCQSSAPGFTNHEPADGSDRTVLCQQEMRNLQR